MSWGTFFYPHKATIQDSNGNGGMGANFAAPREVECEVKDNQKLICTPDGAEVVSSTQVTVPSAKTAPIGSRVKVWAGHPLERTSKVIAVSFNPNDPPLDDYAVLYLE